MSRPLTRIGYRESTAGQPRTGDTLRRESLVDHESYQRPLERAHNSALHGSGVAVGLQVRATRDAMDVRVLPGVAVSGSGDHIVLAAGGLALTTGAPVPVTAAGVVLATVGLDGAHVLTVARAETSDERVFDGIDRLVVDHTPRLTLRRDDVPVDDQAEVVLATVRFAGGTVTALDVGSRRQCADRLAVHRPVPGGSGTELEVGSVVGAELRPGADGGVEIAVTGPGRLTVAAAGLTLRGPAPLTVETITPPALLEITKATRVGGPLDARQGLTVSGGATVNGALDVTGGALSVDRIVPTTQLEITRAARVGGALEARQGLTVTGATALTGGGTVTGGLFDARQGLRVGGAVLDAQQGVRVTGGQVDAQQGLKVTGATTLTGGGTVTGGLLDARQGLRVGGAVLEAQQGVRVTGGIVDAQQGLKVTGGIVDAQVGLRVSGAALDARQGLTVAGPATLGGAVSLTAGATVTGGRLDVRQGLSVTGGFSVDGALDATTFTAADRVHALGDLIADGTAFVRQGLFVTGQATVDGALSAVDPAAGRRAVVGSAGTVGVEDPGGYGVYGIGLGPRSNGVRGEANDGDNAFGVWGVSTAGYAGRFDGRVAAADPAVGRTAVAGTSGTSGVEDPQGIGVYGLGLGPRSNGVKGEANDGDNAFGVWGISASGYAGMFYGRVHVTGGLSNGGAGFRIDHPLDPDGKFLSHSSVESPDMLNVYCGTVRTGPDATATVPLPDYFEALNDGFTYQLTVLGTLARAAVTGEVADNRFTITTDAPDVTVSWQVTGVRKDHFAQQNRIVVEEGKPAGAGAGAPGQDKPALPATPPPRSKS